MLQLRRAQFLGETLSANVANQAGSAECIKQLTKYVIVNVYYERKLLPEELFVSRVVEGVPVKYFAENTDNPRIERVTSWLRDLDELIDEKTLRHAHLQLLTKDANELIESYLLKYSYRDEDTAKDVVQQSTAKSIQNLLKAMKDVFRNNLRPFTDLQNLIIRLTVDTGDIDIGSYAIGRSEQVLEMRVDGNENDLVIGTVYTPFHRMSLRLRSVMEVEDVTPPTDDDVVVIEESPPQPRPPTPELIDIADETDDEVDEFGNPPNSNELIRQMTGFRLNCICQTDFTDMLFTLIRCETCFVFQHAECYGILKTESLPRKHNCHDCSCLLLYRTETMRSPSTGEIIRVENHVHTDQRLIEFTNAELKEIGQMRLLLAYIYRVKQSPIDFFRDNLEFEDFDRLFAKLLHYNILIQECNSYIINNIQVNRFLRRHFKPMYNLINYF